MIDTVIDQIARYCTAGSFGNISRKIIADNLGWLVWKIMDIDENEIQFDMRCPQCKHQTKYVGKREEGYSGFILNLGGTKASCRCPYCGRVSSFYHPYEIVVRGDSMHFDVFTNGLLFKTSELAMEVGN